MNQKNAIKSLIPQRLLEYVPADVRDRWANDIVAKVKAKSPVLYAAIGQWTVIPEEERETMVSEILAAAEEIHNEIKQPKNSLEDD